MDDVFHEPPLYAGWHGLQILVGEGPVEPDYLKERVRVFSERVWNFL